MSHIDQAMHATVHESKIPTREIAKRIGMSHQVLLNKVNPQCETHKLSVREAVALQLATKSRRINDAMNAELSISDEKSAPLICVFEAVLKASREHGDVMRNIQESMRDGMITDRELESCLEEIREAVDAFTGLRDTLIEKNRRAKNKIVAAV